MTLVVGQAALLADRAPGAAASFDVSPGVSCHVFVRNASVIRVLFQRDQQMRQPRSWMVVAEGEQDVPWEGRSRWPDAGPSSNTSQPYGSPAAASAAAAHPTAPTPTAEPVAGAALAPSATAPATSTQVVANSSAAVVDSSSTAGSVCIRTSCIELRVQLQPFKLSWHLPDGTVFAEDRPSRPYGFGVEGQHSMLHSMRRHESDRYYGLGDKTGPLDLHGRRLRTHMTDALGYDAERGDPLYKHWPFLLVKDGASGAAYGILYDNMAAATFDLGCEHSNYYGLYRSYEAADGDLDYYVILGPSIKQVVSRFMHLTGPAALLPRWSLGYAATAMPLADAPDAQQRIGQGFLQEAQAHDVPLSAFHFGSGYTSIGPKRYVFHWNRSKFPDPHALAASFQQTGVRLVANVKPCLLNDHPRFQEVLEAGGFIRDPSGDGPSTSQFWDGEGAHLDFTNPAAVAWWQAGLREALFAVGIGSVWNDNNEYELWQEDALCGTPGQQPADGLPIALARPVQALLMTRASHEAQVAHAPHERPYTITRAGCPGISRYAQTWSGDNTTSWQHLRWNMRTGLNMALSGMFNIGHDVGGFAGPIPDYELLIRWFQCGALHPRFITNSWKSCGTVTSPWMHPGALPMIRWAIRLRYRLMPYLYTLMWTASTAGKPPLRPLIYDFESDEACFQDRDQFMLGPVLMAAPVLLEGARQLQVYLPRGSPGWFDFYTEEWHPAGSTVTVAAPLDRLPLFVPAGAMLPMTHSQNDYSRLHDEPSRCLRVFPTPAAAVTSSSSASCGSNGGSSSGQAPAATATVGTIDGNSNGSDSSKETWTCTLYEDDGLSPVQPPLLPQSSFSAQQQQGAGGGSSSFRPGTGSSYTLVHFDMSATEEEVHVSLTSVEGQLVLPYQEVMMCLPAADTRRLVLSVDAKVVAGLQAPLRLQAGRFRMHAL